MFVIWQGPYLIVSFGSIILSGNKCVTTEYDKISFEGEAQMFGSLLSLHCFKVAQSLG